MLKSIPPPSSSPSSSSPEINICKEHQLATYLKSKFFHTMHGLHTSVGECYLFHGTSLSAVDAIVNTGNDPRIGRGFFGQGCYFNENSSKSDQYTGRTGDPCVMFLCRVLVGQPHIMLQPKHDIVRPSCLEHKAFECLCPGKRFDSVLVQTKRQDPASRFERFREIVIYEGCQAYPEYVVHYKRV
jgi:hypothetical protein